VTVTRNLGNPIVASPLVDAGMSDPKSLGVVETLSPLESRTSTIQVIVDLSGMLQTNEISQSNSEGSGDVTRSCIDILVRVIPPGTPNAGAADVSNS
jgi:hypothetical protein